MSDESLGTRTKSDRFEIVEILVLSLVTIATAWSGFQAAEWGGRQSELYASASSTRFAADASSTLGGQFLVADATILTAWLQAHAANQTDLEQTLVRRFTPEYRAAFDAWLKTDPFHDPSAPAGPGYMPGFSEPHLAQAGVLNGQASALFAEGTSARETANRYIRDTVLFASVIFLIAVAQRFRGRGARVLANGLAIALLAFTLFTLVRLPRLR
jgi:hypothetical protein